MTLKRLQRKPRLRILIVQIFVAMAFLLLRSMISANIAAFNTIPLDFIKELKSKGRESFPMTIFMFIYVRVLRIPVTLCDMVSKTAKTMKIDSCLLYNFQFVNYIKCHLQGEVLCFMLFEQQSQAHFASIVNLVGSVITATSLGAVVVIILVDRAQKREDKVDYRLRDAIFKTLTPEKEVQQQMASQGELLDREVLVPKAVRQLKTLNTLVKGFIPEPARVHNPATSSQNCAIVFIDLKGFTRFSENLALTTLMKVLNIFYTTVHESAKQWHGVVSSFLGDGAMVIFSQETDFECPKFYSERSSGTRRSNRNQLTFQRLANNAVHFVQQVLTMDKKLAAQYTQTYEYSAALRVLQSEIDIRAGIHCGSCILGLFGQHERQCWTALGDVVNVAARVEQATRSLGAKLLITEEVALALQTNPEFYLVAAGDVLVKGKSRNMQLYEVFNRQLQKKQVEMFEQFRVMMAQGQAQQAIILAERGKEMFQQAIFHTLKEIAIANDRIQLQRSNIAAVGADTMGIHLNDIK